ncbi:MAG: tyrosine-type recombinase/integrase [Candidatus Thermoplasmatota archaeon]|nr:tyrosine-type recombinase/integrase [Candidatus Thermoplasmatota archaeon]
MNSNPISSWIERLSQEDLSVHTVTAYRRDATLFARWWEETNGVAFDPAAVTILDLRDYRGWATQKGFATRTINRRLATLRRFFDWCIRQGLSQENPVRRIHGARAVQLAPRGLDRREQGALVRAVERYGNTRDRALITLFLHTGVRAAEASALNRGDVEIRERSGRLVVRGKREKTRVIPLNLTIRRVLSELLAERSDTEPALFIGRRGERLGVDMIRHVVSRYAHLAGLQGVTPHALRHTCAYSWLDAGLELTEIADLLGHVNLETTRIYLRSRESRLREKVERTSWDDDGRPYK